MHHFIPPPLPPVFQLSLLLLEDFCCACTLCAVPLMKLKMFHLTMALRSQEILSSALQVLPAVVDGDLEGNRQQGVHILKIICKVHLIQPLFQNIQDLETMRKASDEQ